MTIIGGSRSNSGEVNDEFIVFMLDNVQLMAIENDAASEPTLPNRMIIRRFNPKRLAHAKSSVEIKETSEASGTGRPPQLHKFHRPPAGSGFIQVGEWVCTLIPGHTVIMKNSFGIYVVPNPTDEHPHMFVGVLLPRGTPIDVERAFIAAISQFATVRASERNDGLSEKLSAHLVTGGDRLARWIGAAAARADAYLTERTERRRGQSVDDGCEPTTTQPKTVNPLIRHGLAFARAGGKRLNNATTALSETVGEIGVGLGKRVVDHVSRHRRDGSTCARFVDNAMTVSRGGLTAAGTVWMSLEDASRTLFRSLADNAARDAEVKHGKEVSESLHNALYAAGHSTMAVYELMELFSPRSVALKIGRKGATQMVRGYHGATATTVLVSSAPGNDGGGGALVTAFDDPMMPSTSSSASINKIPAVPSTKKTL